MSKVPQQNTWNNFDYVQHDLTHEKFTFHAPEKTRYENKAKYDTGAAWKILQWTLKAKQVTCRHFKDSMSNQNHRGNGDRAITELVHPRVG